LIGKNPFIKISGKTMHVQHQISKERNATSEFYIIAISRTQNKIIIHLQLEKSLPTMQHKKFSAATSVNTTRNIFKCLLQHHKI